MAAKAKYKHCSSGSSPVTAVTSTSVTCASSSSSCSGSSDNNKPNEIGADNIYTDEILAKNMTISFKHKIDKGDKSALSCLGNPFLGYLEEQVSKLKENNENDSTCCCATISSRCNNAAHPELSPISSQSAAAAEEKTIRRLRREVLGLYLTLDKTKKDSLEWMLLKTKLDAAREELNAVLEDQQLVNRIKKVNYQLKQIRISSEH